jgi:hypothetical protein
MSYDSPTSSRREDERASLTPRGVRRREEIGTVLVGKAKDRRAGRRVVAAVSCVAVLAAAVVGVWVMNSPVRPVKVIVRRPEPVRETPVVTAEPVVPRRAVIEVAIVRNEPLPSRPCSDVGSDAAARGATTAVCLLDDAHLLRELARTGESYGIVRVGGRVEVVHNGR